MQLQTVRPNIVQAIRAYRVADLMQAAQDSGYHFLYADLSQAQSKQDVLDALAAAFMFPPQLARNMDTLFDGITDLVHKAGPQPGFVVVLEQLPDQARFDREAREQLLDLFRDAADFWGERKVSFRCFYSFAVARGQGQEKAWERPLEPAAMTKPAPRVVSKNGINPNFGMNMPMMSSAFDTAMWLNAA